MANTKEFVFKILNETVKPDLVKGNDFCLIIRERNFGK